MVLQSPSGASSENETSDPNVFRRMLGHFCTGIVIVTALDDGEPVGMTCQSFSSLSLDPPLVMFCPAHTSTTWPRIRRAGQFAVNILSVNQEATGRTFAISGANKFSDVHWQPGVTGAPLLDGSLAYIECRLESVASGGDHDIVIGAPVAMAEQPHLDPLLFFRSTFGRFAS
ncbi:MAG: 3-hydroxy-9,10-secoandrosta,3,5(10)-triene-9,17-dione monooxygenase reductase component [Pseudonocardiales bacterium]|jgi:3-hydroxy-9,10-secoandrosta-1,3,5(10)-triene-9,17-dione monooxygenase reductase component|nr:3-hydroxy-9,10-secoandrosta,3,5(10)-triene-9,17-dione monooxygenase reductase component [Pseudonocardiales bacterium]MDT4970380.1 3-hydroxy-9,10-secoandrosta,3,5(10)-triene-9,17-dione monooxygenase reductase component [Pseudonocardiales bacterium]MDT4982133.1 3-hydroxy-9,10-secoandrosta,3,5(10)-triene-9,17-dione monooxygenase reductase component [Pseudonocardiales bacterium]